MEDSVVQESKKNDIADDKLRWELLPLNLIKEVVKVYHFGAKKYAPNTWQELENGYDRYKAAMLRHIVAHEEGERIDKESKLPHLAHAAWNALAMLYYSLKESNYDEL
jgi:hypothetical protein